MRESATLPKGVMLAIAFAQGILLYLLYNAFDEKTWPSESPLWSFPLWTLALAVPLMVLLSITRENYRSVIKHVGIFAVVLILVAVYTGRQAQPFDAFPVSDMVFVFAFSVALACFKALMYVQQRADGATLSYKVLFTNSWRNFLVGVLSGIFIFVFWLILILWGQLFHVIEIDFFKDLFEEDWFIFPVLSFAFGLGVVIFRDLTRVIDSITKLLHWLIKMLLPLVILVGVIFLSALPFVGLDVLWSTGNGTSLLLWLLALMLFFTNAVYQDDRETNPYPQIIHRVIYAGLCVMPIVAALSFYGLSLRVEQYGWSVARCWAFVTWAILSMFAVGYVWGIIKRRDQWINDLANVNTRMGLVVLAIMLMANSPLLDFRKISIDSQLERVEAGELTLNEFDFWYTHRTLARPGYLAMEDMKQEIGDSDPELLARIESPTYTPWAASAQQIEDLWSNMVYRPEPFEVPGPLRPLIEGAISSYSQNVPFIIQIDLDEDGQNEYVVVSTYENGIGYSQFYYLTDTGWKAGNLQHTAWSRDSGATQAAIQDGDIELIEPRFKHVVIGGIALRPIETD